MTPRSLSVLLHGGPVDLAEVERVRDSLIFEKRRPGPKFFRFSCLLLLASAIATFGLLGDSLAVVIGAMIVAPLMLPIMGLSFSISIGDRGAIINTLLVSLVGIAMSVAVGFGLTWPIAGLMHAEAIQQVISRTAPHLLDLMAALATGLAGAFALSRRDVSDTLPGVAIAVSLVPPLANVGILLALGEPDLASGSLLLFLTNYVAILLAGSLVFVLMGFPQVATSPFDARARRQSLVIACLALVIITIPLALTSQRLILSGKISARAYTLARQWLAGSDYRILSVDAETEDGSVKLLVLGKGALPPLQPLAERSRTQLFGRRLSLEVVQSQTLSFGQALR